MEDLVTNSNFWSGKNVLITGHSGFKGSWLCLWLSKLGANVSGISLAEPVSTPELFSIIKINELIRDFRGDIVDNETCLRIINKTKPEIIFHLAAQTLVLESYNDPLTTYNTNVLGTANILNAARNCSALKVIVVITSDKCYENIEKDYAYKETDPLGGYDPYSSSKACAEHVASAYYRSFFKEKGVGLTTARAGNVIGGGDWSADRLIPDTIKTWSKNEKLIIRYPHATRPWQHVLEPLSGYLTLAEYLWENPDEYSSAWNFGPDQNSVKTVRATVELAAKEWGDCAEWEFSENDHLHEANCLQLSSEKAKAKLGWQACMVFNQTLEETILWYKEYYNNNPDLQTVSLNQIAEYERFSLHA